MDNYGAVDFRFDAEARGDCPLCGRHVTDCAHCSGCGKKGCTGACEGYDDERTYRAHDVN